VQARTRRHQPGALRGLPGGVGERVARRPARRIRPAVHGPRRSASARAHLGRREHEADARAGQAEELAERAQHHQAGAPASGARLCAGVVSAKASSTTSQPPRRARRACQSSRRSRLEMHAGRVVGLHQHHDVAVASIARLERRRVDKRGRRARQAWACSA
jgi:hypothetical protein